MDILSFSAIDDLNFRLQNCPYYDEKSTKAAKASSRLELRASDVALLLATFDDVGAAFAALPMNPPVEDGPAEVEVLVAFDPDEAPNIKATPRSASA